MNKLHTMTFLAGDLEEHFDKSVLNELRGMGYKIMADLALREMNTGMHKPQISVTAQDALEKLKHDYPDAFSAMEKTIWPKAIAKPKNNLQIRSNGAFDPVLAGDSVRARRKTLESITQTLHI